MYFLLSCSTSMPQGQRSSPETPASLSTAVTIAFDHVLKVPFLP